MFFRLIATFFIFLTFTKLAVAEDDTLVFRLDSIVGMVALNQHWKYHAGDDSLWADPGYDDSAWDTLSTTLNRKTIENGTFEGLGWFRLHIQIDSAFTNKTFALRMEQEGASEVYLNGKRIKTFGTFSHEVSEERTSNPKTLPALISFGDSINYVLAVRYSNLRAKHNLQVYRRTEAGFRLEIWDYNLAVLVLVAQIRAGMFLLFLFTVFLVLSLVHFLLYLYYRRQKSNLYYSLFMLLFSVLILMMFQSNWISEYPPLVNRAWLFITLLFPFFFVPLTGFLYSLFMKKTPRIFWVTIGIAVVLSLISLMNLSITPALYVIFVFLLWIEVTRVVIRAMIKRYDGARIIGAGVLFFILFFSFVIIYVIRFGDLVLNGQSILEILFGLSLVAAILSIPVSMSVYLARDFARTNFSLEKQLEQVKILSAKTIEQEREKKRILEGQKEKLEILVKERTKELASEKEKTEKLLLNTLPLKVVNELKQNGRSEPESFDDVTVYFSDIVGFTAISSQLEPKELIEELNDIFTHFDDIMERNSCERIKTIGDAYLAVSGMPERNENHATNMVQAALEIRHFLEKRNQTAGIKWMIRIGIHTGKVVGGIVGVKKYIYDVFGDTINTTSRMESNSEPMRINVSEATYLLLKDRFSFMPREPMEIKGKGTMRMYFLEG